MRNQIKPLTMSLLLLGVISLPSFAQAPRQGVDQTKNLEKEIHQLQIEMHALKQQLKQSALGVKPNVLVPKERATENKEGMPPASKPLLNKSNLEGQPHTNWISKYLPSPGQSFVSTGPYFGSPMAYSGGNLIINSPSINEEVTLLNLRKTIRHGIRELGIAPADDRSFLLLSGLVEGQASYEQRYSKSDMDVTAAGIDAYLLGPNEWTSALISFAYDNDLGTNEGSYNNNSRVASSRLYVNKAMVILGDFEQSPFYATFGQMYVPFGTYSSSMVATPVTRVLGREKARAILVGYQQQSPNALYASAYIFKGDSFADSGGRLNNGGLNAGYRFSQDKITGDFGAGVIANLADSQSMQNNGLPSPFFGGFGATDDYGKEKLVHRVSGLNVHGLLGISDNIDLLFEYIGALQAFSRSDLTYNTQGAKPSAINAEAAYTFTAFAKPSSVAIGFGKTKDALALGLPKERYSLAFISSFWQNTLQTLEFRHDIDYATSSYASGAGSAVSQTIKGTGKSDNAVTFQFDMYF